MNARQSFIFKHFKGLLSRYDGKVPFYSFFKQYCIEEKSLGSKDRKILRELIYRVFRCGPSWQKKAFEDLFFGLANTELAHNEPYQSFFSGIKSDCSLPALVYPFKQWLPHFLKTEDYYNSLTKQPFLWLRPSKDSILHKLQKSDTFSTLPVMAKVQISSNHLALGLPNHSALDQNQTDFEVQDLASQLVCSKIKVSEKGKIWDCCCGSGGKSLYLAEYYPENAIYASDVRPAILENLKIRFKRRQLPLPFTAVVDLNHLQSVLQFNQTKITSPFFNTIIADVPCTGSGTWARDPENLSYFNPDLIRLYAEKQFAIANHACSFLKTGGMLYYITCSVFNDENEEVVNRLLRTLKLEKVSEDWVITYPEGGDNLYIAGLLKR